MPPILGQVDLIEDGMVIGWACEKGDPYKAHEVIFRRGLMFEFCW